MTKYYIIKITHINISIIYTVMTTKEDLVENIKSWDESRYRNENVTKRIKTAPRTKKTVIV